MSLFGKARSNTHARKGKSVPSHLALVCTSTSLPLLIPLSELLPSPLLHNLPCSALDEEKVTLLSSRDPYSTALLQSHWAVML